MDATDDAYSTATELAEAVQTGEVSAVELASAAIERIQRLDGGTNAVVVRDFDRAMDAAEAADTARAHGDRRPLLGVPTTVKESFNIAGLPTTWGMPRFREFIATEDAVAVSRLKAAGAVILGKTNVPFALGDVQSYNDIYGTTNNPWDLTRTPGGSSGGSAAALSAGFGALSIGSDIAGSLRVPAHFTGVYAHKPTFGLVPSRGHIAPPAPPLAYERDLTVLGPMARSAADLSLMLNLLAAPDETTIGIAHRLQLPAARHNDLSSFRVLVVDTHPLIPSSEQTRMSIDRLAERIGAAGTTVARRSAQLPDLMEGARIYMRLLLASLAAGYPADAYEAAREVAGTIDSSDGSLAAERARGSVLSYRDWLATDSARILLRAQWSELFREVDVVITPVTPTTAFVHDHSPDQWSRTIPIDGVEYDYADQLVWAGLATAPGLPATVVPIGKSDGGLPIGAQLIGPLFEDHTPLRFAQLLELEFGGFEVPPQQW
jgi:amidase